MKFGLQVCVNEVANLESLSCKKPGFVWILKIKCRNCNEIDNSLHYITQELSVPIAGGRGTVNHVAKCKVCRLDMKIAILPEYIADYTADDCEAYKTVVAFECRGVEPVHFTFGNDWKVTSTGGKTYDHVDLTEDYGDWVAYEEETKNVVEITGAAYQFVRID